MGRMMSHGLHWSLILILLVVFSALILYVETDFSLSQFVVPAVDNLLEDWLSFFRMVAFIGLGCAFLAVGFWYFWGTWMVSFKNSQGVGKRFMWWVLFIFLCAFVVISIFLTSAQEGEWMAHIFYALNTIGFYYLSTVFCSPVSIKYYPPGAKYLRKLW